MIPFSRLTDFPADVTRLSGNWSARPALVDAISMVVVHATGDGGNEEAAEAWMRNPASQVSAHLHIRRDGTIVRLVSDRRKAWHAGKSEYRLYPHGDRISDCNRVSLGWEFANRNDGRETYTEEQYNAAARLAAHYVRLGLHLENIVGHSVVSPRRKFDPGPRWDWVRFKMDTLFLLYPDPEPNVVPLLRAA